MGKPEIFRKAKIIKDGQTMEIDWAADSAFRFFPIEQDSEMGWRLHLFEMATNKALALSARSEIRDYIDILELGKIYPLAAIIWAACGKDPGFSLMFLLKMMLRFARIRPETLEEIKACDLDPIQMKTEWIEMSDKAAAAMERIRNEQPDLPIGCAFVDAEFKPHWVEDSDELADSLRLATRLLASVFCRLNTFFGSLLYHGAERGLNKDGKRRGI